MNFVSRMKNSGFEVKTECTVLFAEHTSPNAENLLSQLASALNVQTVKLLSDEDNGYGRTLALMTGGCIITMEFSDNTKPRSAFFDALDWPMLHRSFEDAEETVASHKACARIVVETELDALAGGLGVHSMNASFTRAKIAAAIASVLCRVATPSAIHWQSCEMLYRPDEFVRLFEADPIHLFVRITPFSSNTEINDIRVIGASTRGAASFLGVETVLEEAPVPVFWAMDMVRSFISHCHSRGVYLPHLSAYSPQEGEIVIVRHLDSTPEIDVKHVSLEVRRSKEAGFELRETDYAVAPVRREKPEWEGAERRTRPKSAKPFGRRRLG